LALLYLLGYKNKKCLFISDRVYIKPVTTFTLQNLSLGDPDGLRCQDEFDLQILLMQKLSLGYPDGLRCQDEFDLQILLMQKLSLGYPDELCCQDEFDLQILLMQNLSLGDPDELCCQDNFEPDDSLHLRLVNRRSQLLPDAKF